MAQTNVNRRQSAIIKRLKQSPSTLIEIRDYIKLESEICGYDLEVDDRTLHRDKAYINAKSGFFIEYNHATGKYQITDSVNVEHTDRLLQAFDMYNALNATAGFTGCLEFEKQTAGGLENFLSLILAIKDNMQIKFLYRTYWDEDYSTRNVAPYLLKEFKNRWYLIAKNLNKDMIKIYALDRMKTLEVTKKKFHPPADFEPKNYLKDNFGIIRGKEIDKIERVILRFNGLQGKYAKSLPLHTSQRIIKDTDDEVIVELTLYVTFDFEMELLSYGGDVEILEPKSLRDSLEGKLRKALKFYS